MNPLAILTKVDPFHAPTKLLAEVAINNFDKGKIYTTLLTDSFETSFLYCITTDTHQNKWPLKNLDVRVNGIKLDIKREGTPVLIQGVHNELGEQTEITVEIIQEGIKHELYLYLVSSEENLLIDKYQLEDAKVNEEIEEIFSLIDPVTMVPIKIPVVGVNCHHV